MMNVFIARCRLSHLYDGVLINDYIIQPEKLGLTDIANIGVLVHEFGHALGLPDLYDYDQNAEASSGVGTWCLMAGGTWNNFGRTPAQLPIWCKTQLGWVNPTVLSGSGSINGMQNLNNSATGYRMNTPIPTEYFLIENRQLVGWDAYLTGDGLCIYHIDET